MTLKRDERQALTHNWVRSTFGSHADSKERVRRLLEETIELVQAEGASLEEVEAVARHVYSKPVGEVAQEAGGVGICLLAYCASRGLSADKCEASELSRVLTKTADHFRARHQKKVEAGIGAPIVVGVGAPVAAPASSGLPRGRVYVQLSYSDGHRGGLVYGYRPSFEEVASDATKLGADSMWVGHAFASPFEPAPTSSSL